MTYEDYIKLGFKRLELNCSVELKTSGYGGFVLTKQLNKTISIEVCYLELNEPKLYIERSKEPEHYHTIKITPEMVVDLINSFKNKKNA